MIDSQLALAEWEFLDFTAYGNNPIEDWVNGLSDYAESLFWSLLKVNKKIPIPNHWTQLRYLEGAAKEHRLWELRFTADGKAFRIIGLFSVEVRKRALLLLGCYHKQKIYEPPDAINTAIKRKKMLENDEAIAIERKIPTNI